jgi:predicted nucleotidyltransferase
LPSPALRPSPAAIRDFCQRNRIRRLALFGSVLRTDFTPESDVDVLVEFEAGHPIGLMGMARLEGELTAIVGRKVDLREAAELSRHFRSDVLAHARPLYESAA